MNYTYLDEYEIPYEQAIRERDQFQNALDEIAVIIHDKHLDDLTDHDIDQIKKWVNQR